MSTITLLVLSLNEYHGIKAIMPKVDSSLFTQIIFLDGGSTDGTIDLINEMGYEIYIQKRKGIRNGYKEVWPLIRGDYVLTFSPDGNSPAESLASLINEVEKGFDMVIGSRYLPPAKSYDDDPITAFGNWLFTTTVNVLFGSKYTDVMVLLRIFRTNLIKELKLNDEKPFRFVETIFRTKISFEPLLSVRAAKYGKKINEIPVDEPERIGGVRKLQILRWGAAYYSQFFLEKFNLL
tara:strand:+ start:658 stop:1365 length:708 start_codon:yes stop_codon:yes gene_type:complete